MSEEERAEVLAAIMDQCFRNYVIALQETGARPGEVAKVTAENVDLQLGIWVLKNHKTSKKTKRDRVIYLSPRMVELTKKRWRSILWGRYSWHASKMGERRTGSACLHQKCHSVPIRSLREKLPHIKNLIAYSYRHSYATEALMKIGVAQVAELMGHSDVEMVSRHYGHLSPRWSTCEKQQGWLCRSQNEDVYQDFLDQPSTPMTHQEV